MTGEVPMPVPNMETCVFGIQVLKSDVKRRLQEFKDATKVDGFSEHEAAPHDQKLQSMKSQFCDWKQKFVTAVAALKDHIKLYQKYIGEFDETEVILDEFITLMSKVQKSFVTPKPTSNTPNFKLERVKLPSFDGTFSSWEEFHDLFVSAIDSNPTLTAAEKMVYLRTSLTGDALAIVQSFPTTATSYADAWELVKRRFTNPREIAFSHLRKLYEFKRAADSAHDLRKAIDLVNELVRSLKSQKIPVEHWDVILVFWTLKKLDEETRKEWILSQDTSLPTLKIFLEFLEKRACALDDSLARGKKPNPPMEQKKPQPQGKFVFTANGSTPPPSNPARARGLCICCNEPYHALNTCHKFGSASPFERADIVKKAGRCFNCFSGKHSVNECPSKFSCQKCDRKHHTLLHHDSHRNGNPPPQVQSSSAQVSEASYQCAAGVLAPNRVLLSTIRVNVLDPRGLSHPARVFLDSGSEVEFISQDLVRRLGVKPHGSPIQITGISGVSGPQTRGKVNITLCSPSNNFRLPVEAEIIDKLTTGSMPQVEGASSFPHLLNLPLADPEFYIPKPVDILLGNRFASRLKTGGLIHGPRGTPSAEMTEFGWILSGEIPAPRPPRNVNMAFQSYSAGSQNQAPVDEHAELHQLVERFWETEEPDTQVVPRSVQDSACESHFRATTSRDPTGRYTVSLPFRENHPPLGDSFTTAMQRFYSLERRIHTKNPSRQHEQQAEIRRTYTEYFRDNLASGVLETVPPQEVSCPLGKAYYMPYSHVVKMNSSSTKVRIVFDCSAETKAPGATNGPSLNEILYPGPKLQVDLLPLLVRFRAFPYVISADISKFFTQIWIDESQKDFQRLVFREHPHLPLQHFRFRRVSFGISPAPYLAIRVLHQLFEDECSDPSVTELIKTDVLVDNVLTGAFSIPRCLQIQKSLRDTMVNGQFTLCKWASNVDELLADIPPEDREVQTPLMLATPDGLPTLGLRWNPAVDSFTIVIPAIDPLTPITKRSILSASAKLYDPLGLLSPVTIRAKILLQDIWKSKVNWDDPVPLPIEKKWKAYASGLPLLENFVVPRGYFPPCDSESVHYELFGFSDASNHAHSAVVYIRQVTPSQILVALVGAKTKVTPVGGETTPKSELDGAKLLAKFVRTVIPSLPVKVSAIQCYTDSTSVLGWLHPNSKTIQKREKFVLNRVRTISQILPEADWSFVKGTENPADAPSRGISATELLTHPLWLQGPPWLASLRIPPKVTVSISTVAPSPLLDFIKATSSFLRMKNFVASGQRVINNALSKEKDNSPLTPAELENAVFTLVKTVQEECFGDELALLRRRRTIPSNRIKFLAPFIDDRGILRVGGRLSNADVSYDQRHPMLLPNKHHFTEVVIRHLHLKHLHAGPSLLLCILREQFWIFDGLAIVKQIVRRCVVCHRSRPVPLKQVMAPLPAYRVTCPPRPFTTTAIDYAGPFILATVPGRNPRLEKFYFCVFVCAATKATHLELAGSLSTADFVAALTRFSSRRGLPRLILSDNGTNFVGARNELEELKAILESPQFQKEVIAYASECGIKFRFNPPIAPHHGGLFEAAVKSSKYHLRRIVGDRHLSIQEFETLLTQVEAALNSRPLVPLSSDPSDFQVLTPAHFLIGGPLHAVPAEDLTNVKQWRLARWDHVKQMAQHFWKRFIQEYLSTLQSRPKWNETFPDIQPGVLVLVQEADDVFSSRRWNLARVVSVHPGNDGRVRVVVVRTPKGTILRRSITRVAPVPIEHAPILDHPTTASCQTRPPGICSEEIHSSEKQSTERDR